MFFITILSKVYYQLTLHFDIKKINYHFFQRTICTKLLNNVKYKIYFDDPFTGFVEDTYGSLAGESWSTTVINEKKFYYVTVVN